MMRSLAKPIPGAKRTKIRVGYGAEEVGEFGDAQLTVVVAIGHSKLHLEKMQQLRFRDGAFILARSVMLRVVGHHVKSILLQTNELPEGAFSITARSIFCEKSRLYRIDELPLVSGQRGLFSAYLHLKPGSLIG